jgi:hypothetical protein
MKKQFLLLLLIAGFAQMQAQEANSTSLRKGIHIGAHLTPGYGTIFTEAYDNLAIGFGMTTGLDMNIYFSDLLGIHTGVSYLNQPWRYKFNEASIPEADYISVHVSSIGIPVQFLLTTGKNVVGFHLEAGFAVYLPLGYSSSFDKDILKTSSVMFASEFAAGINLKASDKINFNILAFSNTGFHVFSNIDQSFGIFSGLKLGFMYHLK